MAVSPFIDKNFLARLAPQATKPMRRVLLTTMREIERIGPSLAAFDVLLALDAPDYPIGDPEPDPQSAASVPDSAVAEDEEEEVGRGLHAKLLFMRSGQKRRLWLGSANATMRAWTGRNAEVTAELLVTEPVEKGLRAFLGSARLVDAPSIEHSPDAAAQEEEALERARAQVAARWAVQLTISEGERGLHIVPISILAVPIPMRRTSSLRWAPFTANWWSGWRRKSWWNWGRSHPPSEANSFACASVVGAKASHGCSAPQRSRLSERIATAPRSCASLAQEGSSCGWPDCWQTMGARVKATGRMTNCSNEQSRERIQRWIPHCQRSKKCWPHGRAPQRNSGRSSDEFRNICRPCLSRPSGRNREPG